ncbi:MAG: winged helix-turn-helix domain-containing protein [Nitrososphaera sp.]
MDEIVSLLGKGHIVAIAMLGRANWVKKVLFVYFCSILNSNTDFTSMVEILKTRSRIEIIGLILQAVEAEPLTYSKIMYQAMLNFTQVKDYASLLTQEGLLTYLTLERKYTITEKGRKLLALFKETNKLLTANDDNSIPQDNDLQMINTTTKRKGGDDIP